MSKILPFTGHMSAKTTQFMKMYVSNAGGSHSDRLLKLSVLGNPCAITEQ